MRKLYEPGPGIGEGLRDFKINASNFTAFAAACVFFITGALILFASVATGADMTMQQAVSWIMSGTIFGSVATILLCLYYKQPIIILPSLPALLVMGPMFKIFGIREMVAGYLLAAVILFLIGAFGLIGRIGKILPVPVIMGMIAGVFMSYGMKMADAVKSQPLVAGSTIAVFLLAHVLFKKVPPLLIALTTGILLTFLLLPFKMDTTAMQFYLPVFVSPVFNPRIVFSVTIPLVLLALADTLKGYGVLCANEYKVPLNTSTFIAGVVSFAASFFLSHSIVLAGPVTAILGGSSAGPRKHRYVAAVLNALSMIIIGILAGIVLPFVKSLPSGVSGVIAGLAMLGLFTNSLELAFGSKKFQLGAFAAFIVGMSNVTIWGIGAPVWAILFGIIVSLFAERRHFDTGISQNEKAVIEGVEE